MENQRITSFMEQDNGLKEEDSPTPYELLASGAEREVWTPNAYTSQFLNFSKEKATENFPFSPQARNTVFALKLSPSRPSASLMGNRAAEFNTASKIMSKSSTRPLDALR